MSSRLVFTFALAALAACDVERPLPTDGAPSRARLDTVEQQFHVELVSSTAPTHAIAVREGELFFTTEGPSALERAELGGQREQLLNSGGSALLLDESNDSLVLIDDEWELRRVHFDGHRPSRIADRSEIGAIYLVDRLNRALYAAGTSRLFRFDLDDPLAQAEPLVDLPGRLFALAATEGGIYVVLEKEEDGDEVIAELRLWRFGAAKTELVSALAEEDHHQWPLRRRLAIADEWVYFVDGEDGGSVHRVSMLGGDPQPVMTVGEQVTSIVTDGDFVYAASAGGVYRTKVGDPLDGHVQTLVEDMGEPLQIALHDDRLFVTSSASKSSILVISL